MIKTEIGAHQRGLLDWPGAARALLERAVTPRHVIKTRMGSSMSVRSLEACRTSRYSLPDSEVAVSLKN